MTSKTGESESLQAPPREQWSGQLGFLISTIGSAIGLGNIWRFPGVAYTNGGGAFIVPYVIALLAAGLVDDERGEELLHTVFHHLEQNQTLILDGGALSILAKTEMKFPKVHLVLTPHQREWQVLSGLDLTSQGTEETGEALKRFPSGTILVQKGPATRIWQSGRADCYQVSVGGPYQATGGMGDTLAGMIAGFVGQFPHINLYERVVVATHLHSAIAQELAQEHYVVLPSQISCEIPKTMKKISQKGN